MRLSIWYAHAMPVAYRYSVFSPGFARPRAMEACILVGVIATLLGISSTAVEWTFDTEPAYLDYAEYGFVILMPAVWLRVLILWKTQHTRAKALLRQRVLPCVRCGYPLADHPRPMCTECGHKHERSETIKYWREIGVLTYPSWLHTQNQGASSQNSPGREGTGTGGPPRCS